MRSKRKSISALAPTRNGIRDVFSPEGEMMDMERMLGTSVHNSIEKPVTFSPTLNSTVFVSSVVSSVLK